MSSVPDTPTVQASSSSYYHIVFANYKSTSPLQLHLGVGWPSPHSLPLLDRPQAPQKSPVSRYALNTTKPIAT